MKKIWEYIVKTATSYQVRNFLGGVLEFIKYAVMILFVVAMLCGIWHVFATNYCDNMKKLHTDVQIDYSFWTNCRAQMTNGKWILMDEYLQYYGDMHTLNIGEVGE